MGKGVIIGIVAVLIVLVILFGVGLFSNLSTNTNSELSGGTDSNTQAVVSPGEDTKSEDESNQETEEKVIVETSTEKIVEITSSGFSPETLTINSGDKVTWTNKGSRSVWPASNNHPTHTIYSGFDSLKGLKSGESYSFKFDKVGIWKYHDHLSPSTRGTIIVN